MSLEHAIAVLEIAADNAEHNAPISQAEGNAAQADLQRVTAAECREAIKHLEQVAQ
ncbi:hypothetical protein [Stutzerimonas kirkiae]|uniref:hypothetical protein n=1 Tax=Stutzerimonas kirkiae TaxID=2211392 RepID=UPI0013F16E5B|nr:hypothetical protein [Stutzerimonas kirkiae]